MVMVGGWVVVRVVVVVLCAVLLSDSLHQELKIVTLKTKDWCVLFRLIGGGLASGKK